jgi:hypothetical protein
MEKRHGLVVDACLTMADGHAERMAAVHMTEPHADQPTAITLGADKAYDAEDFVNELRSVNVTPHVAQNTSGRSSAIDERTTRHGGYAVSQRIEEAFGWIKTVAGQEKTRFRGRDRVGWALPCGGSESSRPAARCTAHTSCCWGQRAIQLERRLGAKYGRVLKRFPEAPLPTAA